MIKSAFARRGDLLRDAFLSLKKAKEKRVKGIEPSCAAWEAAILPLNYTRDGIADCKFQIFDCNRNHDYCHEITSSDWTPADVS